MSWLSSGSLLALGILMASSALPKLRTPQQFRSALVGYGIPIPLARALTPALIGFELISAVACFMEIAPRLVAIVCLLSLGLYSVIVLNALRIGRSRIRCGCSAFGNDRTLSWTLVARNVCAGMVAILPIWSGARAHGATEWLCAALAGLTITVFLALVDEIGFIYDLRPQ